MRKRLVKTARTRKLENPWQSTQKQPIGSKTFRKEIVVVRLRRNLRLRTDFQIRVILKKNEKNKNKKNEWMQLFDELMKQKDSHEVTPI